MKCIQNPARFLKAIYSSISLLTRAIKTTTMRASWRCGGGGGGKSNLQFFSPFPQYLIFFSLFLSLDYTRTIDHTVCAFNLPTEFNASGQEHIIDDEDKVKIKVDPTKMSLDGIELHQLEVIVDGWFKYIAKIFRDACEKVSVCCWWSS